MNRCKTRKFRKWPFFLGTVCIFVAAMLLFTNQKEDLEAGRQADLILKMIKGTVENETEKPDYSEPRIPDYKLNPEMEMPVKEIDGYEYIGTLAFPSMNCELPVMSSWSYAGLKIAPGRYSGTVYKNNAVIAAHNYTSHFGKLFDLEPGSVVIFTDIDGNEFVYEVIVQEVLAPTEIREMTESEYDLTLFTCTLGGSSRFAVRCLQSQ